MPLSKIHLTPGVTTQQTPTGNEGGYSVSQLVRFFSGQLQKLGGWSRMPGIVRLLGTCRGLFGWADLVGTAHLAAGTDQRLYVITGGVLSDITPISVTTDASPAIATTAGSNIALISDAANPVKIGDTVNVLVPVSRGGVIIQGFYTVVSKLTVAQFGITLAAPAVTTQTFGGVVPAFTTVNGSPTVTVAFPDHGQILGSNFPIQISVSVGGLTLFGNFIVSSVIDTANFTITAPALATSSVTVAENNGQMELLYLLASGQPQNQSLGGWGAGDWGAGDWGGSSTIGVTTPLVAHARTWSLDHFGQDLIASPDLGPIYFWAPPIVQPASTLPNAPIINKVVLCLSQVQIIVSFGSEVGGSFFPTLLRWCDQGDFTDWIATTDNQAGSFQLPSGSAIVAALAIGLGALIWTDVNMYSMTYQGLPFVFSIVPIAVACEAISKKSPAVAGSRVIWPSTRGFFSYDGGGVAPVECPVSDFFFNNLDLEQSDSVCSGVNTLFNEIAWFFPMIGGGTGYVKWNYLGGPKAWDYGIMDRTAWVDRNPYGNPMGADSTGLIMIHEQDTDADGTPMESYGQSGYYDLGDGSQMIYTKTIIPDFILPAGTEVQITILAVDYPGQTPRVYGPFTINSTTKRINQAVRARQIAFRIGSNTMGKAWRTGAIRYEPKPTGSRP